MAVPRSQRVAEEIKQTVGELLLFGAKDPALQPVTVTQVKVSRDLRHATILYSVLGDDEVKEKAHEAVQRAQPFVRSEIAQKLRLRYVPEIRFEYDDTSDYAAHIAEILQKIKKNGGSVDSE
jgi:ribosome-binding factor A